MVHKPPPNDTAVVAMKNDVIPTLAALRLNESRLFQYCIAHYDSRSTENPTFEASVGDLKRFFEIDYADAYPILRQAVINIGSKPIEWRDGNVQHFENWFTGFSYYGGTGRFVFRINRAAEPFFLTLKECFTRYRLAFTKHFRHAASVKLYINLKQHKKMGHWNPALDDLKHRLGVGGKYSRWSDLRERILQPSMSEINKHSDLSVGWKPTKSGRRATGVAFRIKNKTEKSATEAREVHEANQRLKTAQEEEKRLGINHVEFDPLRIST